MSIDTTHPEMTAEHVVSAAGTDVGEKAAVAFGVSAAVTVLFNTVLAWAKETIPALEEFMAALTGHHWWTHGLFDLIVFVVVGGVLMSRGSQEHLSDRLAIRLALASVIAGLGLAVWFFFI